MYSHKPIYDECWKNEKNYLCRCIIIIDCAFLNIAITNFSWDLGESGGDGELGLEVSSGVGSLALLLLGSASWCKVRVEGTGIFEAGT